MINERKERKILELLEGTLGLTDEDIERVWEQIQTQEDDDVTDWGGKKLYEQFDAIKKSAAGGG